MLTRTVVVVAAIMAGLIAANSPTAGASVPGRSPGAAASPLAGSSSGSPTDTTSGSPTKSASPTKGRTTPAPSRSASSPTSTSASPSATSPQPRRSTTKPAASPTPATLPPEVTVAPTDPTSVQLPKVALAALTTVPDYNVDPLLLAGLQTKLVRAEANEKTLEAAIGAQQGELVALAAQARQLRTAADSLRGLADTAHRNFQIAASASYMSDNGLSPAMDAMFSPASSSPADVMYSADITTMYAADQSAQMKTAVKRMTRTAAAADVELAKAAAATKKLQSIQRRDQAAKLYTQQVKQKIRARIAQVRRDLAAKQAVEQVASTSATGQWKGYLAELGIYGVRPPAAAQLRDPSHLPKGLLPVVDSSGAKQAGVAKLHTKHGDVLVLPREVIAAVGYAFAQLGKPYVWAATGPNSFDCSGLTLASYRSAGITTMPRVARDQYSWTTRVQPGQEMPGDLVFFAGDDGTMTSPGHVAMVIDPVHHLMIQAPQTGDVVKVSNYAQWGGLVGFGRVTTAG